MWTCCLTFCLTLDKAYYFSFYLTIWYKFFDRDPLCHKVMKSSLRASIKSNNYEIANKIMEKIGEDINNMTSDPQFDVFFGRYYKLSKYLTKSSTNRQKTLKNIDNYKNLLIDLLQPKKDVKTITLASLEKDYDCPVCFEYMCPPSQIYTCHNGHLLCSFCLSSLPKKICPQCRDDFAVRKPMRSFDAEKKAKQYHQDQQQ